MILDNPISDLQAKISERGGLARSNLFGITFTGPASVNPDIYLVNAICESVSLPGRSISTNEHGTWKHATKHPYTFINDDVTMTFLVTNDFYIKRLMDNWMRSVINDENGVVYYKKQYASDIIITNLDLKGNMVYKTTLQGAFPIQINAIELSNASENELIRLSVTFTYENFKTNTTYFSLATSLAELINAISFPNPLMPSVPFSPFGDLGAQAETILAGLKGEIAGELSAVLQAITGDIRGKITANANSITVPYEGSLGSVVNQLSGKVTNIFGAGLSGTMNEASSSGGTSLVSRATSAVKSLFG